jgi:peptidoglycan hydrolase-like protein with peptidoglycan-binding domain
MKLEKGIKSDLSLELQKKLNQYNKLKYGAGKFIPLVEDGDFGNNTYKAVVKFQSENDLLQNGIVNDSVMKILLSSIKKLSKPKPSAATSDTQYKNLIIEGSTFPGTAYSYDVKFSFTGEMKNEYIPELEHLLHDAPKGLKLLLTIMAQKEGFKKGTRSYVNNNPGNIGNTDSGANKKLPTLKDGILLQKQYVENVANGKHPAYPMNKLVKIKPYYSEEIAKNQKTYGLSPYLPGYNFVFTGQLDQYVKIYSTGARGGNGYINLIISYFKKNNITITPESKIQDIIRIN